jgi:hypothetical protein
MHVFLVLYFSASCIPTDESLLILLQPCVGCVVNLVKLMLYHDCLRLARTTYLVTSKIMLSSLLQVTKSL